MLRDCEMWKEWNADNADFYDLRLFIKKDIKDSVYFILN